MPDKSKIIEKLLNHRVYDQQGWEADTSAVHVSIYLLFAMTSFVKPT